MLFLRAEMTARWKDDPNLVDGTVGYADSAEIVLFSIKVSFNQHPNQRSANNSLGTRYEYTLRVMFINRDSTSKTVPP